ncbi:MurR/RpiR family transcriptional regulator [Lactobacillus helveticus]|uniref:MurR/RpiR family transcriptional regulator n=1 Tax=Lactobacillus helveticus TaxID=1587 RepID=UPI0015624353|nr:MurR/RpiR family transcriptional regulator [Lactobacillus helveticus]NRO04784.1 putative HTH-type transcriptional regulator YbbH [Lactobacillus helveticus]NRO39083.1 putative HTH-type transcriptional regulator YbbH [Lactobacillus helveticus]
MNFMQLFNEKKNKLTKSEIKLAEYIAAHHEQVIYSTMKALSEKTNMGNATIVRLCKKLGFSGFSQLKIALAQDSIEPKKSKLDDSTYYASSAKMLINSIKQTEELVKPESLGKALTLLLVAKRVYLFGVGHSGESAKDYEKTWLRIGLVAHAETDPHLQVQIANLLGEGDVVVGLSLSGHTRDTYDSLELAKDNGAKIITISNDLNSPISQLGDARLQTAVGEFTNIGSVSGQVSQLYLCDVLARGYEQKTDVDTDKLKEHALQAVIKKSI